MPELESNKDIGSLPNEILINILSIFPTRSLLPLTPTSRRIHDVIVRIIYYRLLTAAKVADHQIILECYLPSAKLTTPYFVCDFLGTDLIEDTDLRGVGALGKLRDMYSHFRPVPPKGDHKTWKTIPTSGVLPTTMNEFIFGEKKYVSQDIDLEPYELFSQLQSIVSMVKVGPREGYFLSNVTIGEGLTRVWRNWLIERAECSTTKYCPEAEHKKRLLWASIREHIGLRFCIAQKTDVAGPILKSRDDDENVGYTLQYEELVVRTSQILLSMEQALEEEVKHEGTLCGLDGVYVQQSYRGRRVEESREVYWRPVIDAYAGHPRGALPVLIR